MSRRILVALVTVGVALAVAIPAAARTSAHRSRLSLRIGGHIAGLIRGGQSAVTAVDFGPATVAYEGFKCEVTIGQGSSDTTYRNHFVFDSIETYVPYRASDRNFDAVTTNCIGSLPAGTVVAPTIVTAKTTNCGQINPFDQTAFISGVGTTTTFPDGMFTETCTTPTFR